MLRSMTDLKGFTIGATDGDMGHVEAFYFDDTSFTVRHLVVKTAGWLSDRKVLVSPIALRDVDWDGRRINVALSKTQVEQSPPIDAEEPVSRQQEVEYYGYYGYPFYWAGPYLWGAYQYPVPPTDARSSLEEERPASWSERTDGDPHLRNSGNVIGYHIAATDGDIGHVEDFLVDDTTWAIRYMVVDTSNWWFGKKVLVSPGWVAGVDWNDSKLHVDMTREQIKNAPEYDPSELPRREYEMRLYDYYGRPGYWKDEATTRRR
ncbi:MAG: PRC-barrel domain containing protein [Chloroflexi bacterium]|nr:MAG: PRC-barrel domain containing protein [Chloroflexota bacterium]